MKFFHVFQLLFLSDKFLFGFLQFIKPIPSDIMNDSILGTKLFTSSLALVNMKESLANIYIDLGRMKDQIIVVRNILLVKTHVFFSFNTNPNVKQLHAFICHQASSVAESKCIELNFQQNVTISLNVKIITNFLPKTNGFHLCFDTSQHSNIDMSGLYFFKISTEDSGFILSNVLEIRDVIFWERNILISSQSSVKDIYKQDISIDSFPIMFHCLDNAKSLIAKDIPFWLRDEIISPIKWEWCPVADQNKTVIARHRTYVHGCLEQTSAKCDRNSLNCPISEMPNWDTFVLFDGTLVVLNGSPFINPSNILDGYALMCHYKFQDQNKALRFIAAAYDPYYKVFYKGLQWRYTVNSRRYFEILSPFNQTVKVGVFHKGFVLHVLYRGPLTSSFEWFKEKDKIIDSEVWKTSRYSLSYLSKVNLEMQGNYYLRIRHNAIKHEFKVHLSVLTPPLLSSAVPKSVDSIIYLLVESNFSITYKFRGNVETMNYYINGIQFHSNFTNSKLFIDELSKKASHLKDLQINTAFFKQSDFAEFTYFLTHVSYSQVHLKSQDHSLIVEAINKYGVSRQYLNIYVLNMPIFKSYPIYDNCTSQCSSSEPHFFGCEFNSDYFVKKDVEIEKTWFVNNIALNSLPYYNIFFLENSTGLLLYPVKSNNTKYNFALKSLLKNAKLSCRVRLLYMNSFGMPERKLVEDNRIIYDSNTDEMFVSQSMADIRLDGDPLIVAASYTWVVFLIIAAILIAMFMFLLVKMSLRDQGKSYQIEKLEIAKGYDRDEEIFENETIKPYTRSDSSKVLKNNSSVEEANNFDYNSYNHKGVLHSIDDEMDESASKFNEEGSFIGQYSQKTGRLDNSPNLHII